MKEFEDSSRNLNYLAKLKQGKSRLLGLHLLRFIHLQSLFLRIISVIWYIYHHFKYCSEFTKIHCRHKNRLIGLCKTRWILLIWLSSFFIFKWMIIGFSFIGYIVQYFGDLIISVEKLFLLRKFNWSYHYTQLLYTWKYLSFIWKFIIDYWEMRIKFNWFY